MIVETSSGQDISPAVLLEQNISYLSENFLPTTSVRRIRDVNIPEYLSIGGKVVKVPKSLAAKDISYVLSDEILPNGKNKVDKTVWITPGLSHLMNSYRFRPGGALFKTTDPESSLNTRIREQNLALECIYSKINTLVKDIVLKDRRGPGLMAFVQANENVPEDSIYISYRTFKGFLVPHNSRWKNASGVTVTRFPNLGPNTTCKLKLLVQANPTIGVKDNQLTDQLKQIFGYLSDDDILPSQDLIDCVYLHPKVLKEYLQGDGDGDTVFICLNEEGGASFDSLNLIREPGDEALFDETLDKLKSKTQRKGTDQELSKFLVKYFENTMIGPVTYAIKFQTNIRAKKYRGVVDHPTNKAWEEISSKAIEDVEFVMDYKKGDFTDEQIADKFNYIQFWMQKIKEAREHGDWFARTVTSSSIEDIEEFLVTFPTLQSFIDEVYVQ